MENPLFKRKYLKAGNLVDNIKQLKENNKSKRDTKYKKFYKIYKPTESSSITTEQFYRTTSDITDKLERNTTHHGTRTHNKEYKTSANFYYNKSTSDELKNEYLTTYTSFHKPHIYHNEKSEEDALALVSFYHVSEAKSSSLYNKSEKEEFFRRYNINKRVNDTEKEKVKEVIDENKTSTNFHNTNSDFSKAKYRASPYYFDDPIKSFKKLKVNSQIFNNVQGLRTEKQIRSYIDLYAKEAETHMKVMQMPKVRELKGTKHKNQELAIDTVTTERSDNQDNGLKTVANKQHSREQVLYNNLEVHVSHLYDNGNKPGARSLFTMNLDNSYLILYGGVGFDKYSDVWICDLKRNNICNLR